jgi:hypothetical protein
MNYSKRALRLYLANPMYVVGVPTLTLVGMSALMILIAVIVGIAVGLPLPPEIAAGFRTSLGPILAFPGFLVTLGVLAVNRNFAMALAFGGTRRHFWFGTSLGFAVTSLATAVTGVVLLGLEKLTDGWFVHTAAFDIRALGGGDVPTTFTMLLLISLLSMYVGALFGTVYRAFGTRALVVAVVLSVCVVVLLFAVGVWQREWVSTLVADQGLSAVAGGMAVLAGGVAAVSYATNRLATV